MRIGIPEWRTRNGMTVYPNPANEVVHIVSDVVVNSCVIYNILGQVVKMCDNSNVGVGIDITDLPPGKYYLRINGNQMTGFVKQ